MCNKMDYYTSQKFNELLLAERDATFAMLDSVLFILSNVSDMMSIGQETEQHLSPDLMFAVSNKMTQNISFVEKYKGLPVL